MTTLRLLRGRVMLRPEPEPLTQGNIIIPDTARDKRENKNSLGIGVVLALGPPALTPRRWSSCESCNGSGGGPFGPSWKDNPICAACNGEGGQWRGGVEVPYDFKVGDRVRHIGQHISRRGEWADEEVVFCSQEEVQCVIEPDTRRTGCIHGPDACDECIAHDTMLAMSS